MNRIRTGLVAFSVVSMLVGGLSFASTEAIRKMAEITMSFNHFPSDEDKAALKGIVDSDDSSDDEASIAMALANMQHKVADSDVERLQDIVDDESSDEAARKLAGILLSINHAASDGDKAALATLASM